MEASKTGWTRIANRLKKAIARRIGIVLPRIREALFAHRVGGRVLHRPFANFVG